jgi:archaeal flagellar protein FlaI
MSFLKKLWNRNKDDNDDSDDPNQTKNGSQPAAGSSAPNSATPKRATLVSSAPKPAGTTPNALGSSTPSSQSTSANAGSTSQPPQAVPPLSSLSIATSSLPGAQTKSSPPPADIPKPAPQPTVSFLAKPSGSAAPTFTGPQPIPSTAAAKPPATNPPASAGSGSAQPSTTNTTGPQATVVVPGPAGVKSVQTKQELKPLTPLTTSKGKKPDEPVDEKKAQELAMEKQFPFLRRTKVKYPATGSPVPLTWKVIERYPVNSPFAYAVIADSPLLTRRYFLDEVPLTKTEAAIYSYLLDALEAELTVPREQVNPRQYFAEQARKILLKYSIRVPAASWSKIIYFAERDLVGFGVLDGLMRDPQIEDISIDAVGKPIFVYHKGHDSLETNVTIAGEDEQDNIITRLSHQAGKHVSTAFPIVQGTLPGRHRLIATFRREVSPQGSTATIRKFREDPLTIIDMLNLNLLNHEMAAYAWYLMQNRATAIVVGATGAGKTTLLNALLTLTRLTTKIVTIEEVQEINIPHSNWAPLVSRESYAATEEKAGEVNLFDLVKAAMRMRPDILVVGEVRGEEAYVLFQAISTGHGGLCTLHADDAASAVQRLVSEPMNVPKAFLPFLDLMFVVRRISVPAPGGGFRSIRRVISVDEIMGADDYFQSFRWDVRTDQFAALYDKSPKLERLARDSGIQVADALAEIRRRSVILRWLQSKGIRNFRELSPLLELYVTRPNEVYNRAVIELEAKGIPVETAPQGAPKA